MIYCVEDEESIRELMLYTLNMAGFEAKGFPEGKAFWTEMKDKLPELIILDIMLPGENGIAILKALRSSPVTSDIPVIMATAKGSEYDRVTGLDLGADDYLSKPFGMMEMISRIKAVLRRSSHKGNQQTLKIGNLMLDEEKHVVESCGQSVVLTLKEYELLKLFMENSDKVFSRENLLSSVWGQDYFGETRTVDVHVGSLRTKLGSAGKQIQTVRGVGYKLSAFTEGN